MQVLELVTTLFYHSTRHGSVGLSVGRMSLAIMPGVGEAGQAYSATFWHTKATLWWYHGSGSKARRIWARVLLLGLSNPPPGMACILQTSEATTLTCVLLTTAEAASAHIKLNKTCRLGSFSSAAHVTSSQTQHAGRLASCSEMQPTKMHSVITSFLIAGPLQSR